MAVVFFSYSHKDESLRDQLEVHLSMLKREGVITTWHDRRILPGTDLHGEISENLENANLILLLVSADFLASDYCYQKEMQRALERHAEGSAKVIPIILRPCDWSFSQFNNLAALPKNGRPVTKFPDFDDAFTEITRGIRSVVSELPKSSSNEKSNQASAEFVETRHKPRSSNLRIKKEFTDHDKDAFLDESFEYIANYFEGSLTELQARNPGITTRFRRVDANHFTAYVYKSGKTVSECSIQLGSGFGNVGIQYSRTADRDNGFNDSLSVRDNGHALVLKSFGMGFGSRDKEELTSVGAAEHYWQTLLEPLQS